MRWTLAIPILAACGFGAPRLSGDAGAGTDVPAGDDAGDDASGASWWDPAWPVRMRIAIDSTAALGAGFQLGLRRDLDAPPCNGPRDGVRVVRDHMTELPRVIDELGGDEWIWFRIAAPRAAGSGPSEYWLYCGNAGAGPAPSDPATVFELYDDFDGGALSQAWRTQGGVTIGGGAVTLPGNNTGIRSESLFGPGTATDFILQVSSNALANPWFWGGFEIGFTVTPPWVIWHSEDPDVIKQEIASGANEVSMNSQPLDLGAHLYGVEHHGTLARFRFNNAEVGSIPYGPPIGQVNVRIHNYQSGGGLQLLMARVRKAVSPIPTATLGPVENRP